MFFKSLELQGFKSFPDRVKLHFDKGLTAVVGPNGSGKSNIGDAIRWVLGEQSTKTLRGNRMEDIIFAGTKQRRPTGFASVTIQLDNQSGLLGDTYGDTVAITRKLYRSGESMYQINGKNVRLKDVQELLMDTGMGRDGYAIIGQGRIAEIVSAKSTDRRELFEEAAGVSKFRYKREEAERNLRAAQENLVRLQDIAAGLEGRVEPLRQQAEKAKQFLALSEQQKKLEISLWMQQLTALEQEKNDLQESLLKAKAEFQNAELDLERADAALQQQYQQMQQSTVKIQNLRQAVQEAESKTAQMQAEIAVCENEQQHTAQQLVKLAQEKTETDAAYQTAGTVLQHLNASLQDLQQQQAQAEAACTEQETVKAELTEQANVLTEALQMAEAKLQAGYGTQSEQHAKAQSLATQIETLQAQMVSQSAQAAVLHQQQQEAAEAAARTEETAKEAAQIETAVRVALEAAQAQQAAAQKTAAEVQQQKEQLHITLQTRQQRHHLLQEMEHSMEGYAGSVKAVLQAEGGKPHGVYGTVSQMISTDAKYSLAIETALGGAMQHFIVEDETAAKDWIRYLAKRRAGRATFLPLTSIRGKLLQEPDLLREAEVIDLACNLVRYDPKFTNVIHSLLGRIVVAENLDAATDLAKRYGYRFRIVTLDGQVINAGGSFTGGSSQKSGGMLTRKNELSQLQQEIFTLQQQMQQKKTAWETAKNACAEQDANAKRLQTRFHAAESERLLAVSNAEHAKERLQQMQEQLLVRQQQRKQLEDTIAEQKQQYADAKAILGETLDVLTRAKETQNAVQKQREEIAVQQTAATEMLATLQVQAATLTQTVSSKQQEIAYQQERQTALQQKQMQLQQEEAACEAQQTAQQQQKESLTRQLAALQTRTEQNRQAIQQLQRVHAEQEQKIRQMQDGMREWSAARERAAAVVSQLETKQHTLTEQKDRIVQQMLEQYDVMRSEAHKFIVPVRDPLKAKQELSALRQQIRALGNVNVSAIEEYQTVSEQWKFLSAQLKDATQAKQELEALIVQLTAEMQRLFTERFAEINQAFQQIFRELFGGGDADLRLTDPEDVLNSGIDIHVAPPGKVIKNLIALSGGEQSFVAIAIYFAILRLRPTPFCIMDEIDAALDEGNVRRYVQYLQQFMDTTQFILITHRRSAMEAADVLYGVTMQEDGISRLLHMEQPSLDAIGAE